MDGPCSRCITRSIRGAVLPREGRWVAEAGHRIPVLREVGHPSGFGGDVATVAVSAKDPVIIDGEHVRAAACPMRRGVVPFLWWTGRVNASPVARTRLTP